MVLQKVVHTKEDFVVLDIVTEQISSEKFLISKQKKKQDHNHKEVVDVTKLEFFF